MRWRRNQDPNIARPEVHGCAGANHARAWIVLCDPASLSSGITKGVAVTERVVKSNR